MSALALQYEPRADLSRRLARVFARAERVRPVYVDLPRATLSICFDDFTESAAREGAAALERYDARGTFYASAALMEEESAAGVHFCAEDLNRLVAAGHEIGCGAYRREDFSAMKPEEVFASLGRNAVELALAGYGRSLRSLAYPLGETTRRLKRALPADFVTARGATPGLNRGWTDFAELKAYSLYGWDCAEPLLKILDAANERGAWMIVRTHDVSENPSPYGAPLGALGALLRKARELDVDILPVGVAADRILAAQDKD